MNPQEIDAPEQTAHRDRPMRAVSQVIRKDNVLRPEPLSKAQPSASLRLNRVAVGVMFFMHGLCFASWASRIPTIQESLKLSSSMLGTVLFALPVGFFLSLPLAGWLVGKLGSRRTAVLSALVYSVSLLCIGASSTTTGLILSLFAFGFFANLLNISINTQAVLVEKKYARKLMASFHGLWSLAGFAGAAIGATMIGRDIVPFTHYLFIAITFVLVITISVRYLVMKDDVAEEKRPLFAMPDKSLVGLGVIAFCSMMAEGAMFDWSGIYFSNVVHAEAELIGLGYTVFMIAMAAMRFLADGIATRFGLIRILQLSGVLTTVGLLTSVVFPDFIPALAGFFLIGMGVSSVVPMVYSAAGKSKTMSPGTAITAVSSLGFMGLLIGPPVIGFIAEVSGLRISFLAMTIMSLAVVAIASRIPDNLVKHED